MRPVIGITTPNTVFHPAYYFIKLAVWLCGGKPLPLRTLETIDTVRVDGLVVGGGTDVFPELFNAKVKDMYTYDHNRDEMEIAWLKKAEREDIPVLGICRGAQMMNVMNGGSLHLDVALAYENAHYPKSLLRKIFFRKDVFIAEGSLLHKFVQSKHARLNSMHTQSVDRLGENLVVTAQEKNGVVQAIERPGHHFYLGVQFHPEYLIYRPSMRALFHGFIRSASGSQAHP